MNAIREDVVTQQDVAEAKAELKEDIAELRVELKEDISKLRGDVRVIQTDLAWIKKVGGWAISFMMLILITIVALLLKIGFYGIPNP